VNDDIKRNQRIKPEVMDELRAFRAKLVQRFKWRLITHQEVNRAFADALAQVVKNDHALIDDDREYTRVKCRDCGHTTSVLAEVDKWSCRHAPYRSREKFVDAIGVDGEYLLDKNAMPLRPKAIETTPYEDQTIRGYFPGFNGA
jgi:hypothetical protein